MHIKKLLLSLPLTLMLSASALTQPSQGPGPNSSSGVGPLHGKWEQPGALRPGHFMGKVETEDGIDLFRIVGEVDRRHPLASDGALVGVAELLVGPNAGTKFPIRGRWRARSKGAGTFHAKILGKKRTGSTRHVLLDLRGAFHDRDPQGPGKFKGRWSDPN